MITFKCKMCGGDLHPIEGATICECEYCGSVQTIPTADNEKKMNLFGRAQRLLRSCEFDKAAGVYESIAAEFPEEAEAYWGLVLCKYGIEYVDDPATGKKVPTCHRTRPDSVLEDSDFEQACENSDPIAKRVYRDEAKAIDRLQQEILSVVANESPYDVFICYKETDDNGERTEDSVLGQEIFDALTAKELKVFFARITLEDKLGQSYEPFIYAALHSAKVMIAIGTQYEYYNAVWVKNEWARFLSMMTQSKSKTLIPCYKNIDAYDMPREFKNLQAQDMGKLGWLQDLTRGVVKLCGDAKATGESGGVAISRRLANLMNRADAYLQSSDWMNAISVYSTILDTVNEKYAPAYIGILCAKIGLNNPDDLARMAEDFTDYEEWNMALACATEEQKKKYNEYLEQSEKMIKAKEEADKAEIYLSATLSKSFGRYLEAMWGFGKILDFSDAAQLAEECLKEFNNGLREQYQSVQSPAIASHSVNLSKLQNEKRNYENELSQKKKNQTAMKKQLETTIGEISRLERELASVTGFFSGKRKKELQSEINKNSEQKTNCERDLAALPSRISWLTQKISETEGTIAKEEQELKREKERNKYVEKTLDDIMLMEQRISGWGKTIKFGEFMQNDKLSKQKIEWIVLGWNNEYLYLASKYILDWMPYMNRTNQSNIIDWQHSNLRIWINTEFMDTAFRGYEREMIYQLHLLDKRTIETYFPSDEHSIFASAAPTDYALLKGASPYSGKNYRWWLQDLSDGDMVQVYDIWTGTVFSDELTKCLGVRPYLGLRLSMVDFSNPELFGNLPDNYGNYGFKTTMFEKI